MALLNSGGIKSATLYKSPSPLILYPLSLFPYPLKLVSSRQFVVVAIAFASEEIE